jgi:hypothetical protein
MTESTPFSSGLNPVGLDVTTCSVCGPRGNGWNGASAQRDWLLRSHKFTADQRSEKIEVDADRTFPRSGQKCAGQLGRLRPESPPSANCLRVEKRSYFA